MNNLKDKALNVKTYISNRRGRICFLAGIAATMSVTQSARSDWDAFLTEKGLRDEFYGTDEV